MAINIWDLDHSYLVMSLKEEHDIIKAFHLHISIFCSIKGRN